MKKKVGRKVVTWQEVAFHSTLFGNNRNYIKGLATKVTFAPAAFCNRQSMKSVLKSANIILVC